MVRLLKEKTGAMEYEELAKIVFGVLALIAFVVVIYIIAKKLLG
jgi:hypothetical protein